MLSKISCEKIRWAIKCSSFLFEDIALMLNISERNLYHKLKTDTLRIKELNDICKVLNLNINDICE